MHRIRTSMHIMLQGGSRDHLVIRKCDPRNRPVEKKRQTVPTVRPNSRLSALSRQNNRQLLATDSALRWGCLLRAWREREMPRLGGCAGRLRRTCLGSPISLITGKIQGNFPDLAAKARRQLGFPIISQLLTPKFPTHPNREFCRANRELFPAEQGKSLAKSPADGIFGKDRCYPLRSHGGTPNVMRRAKAQ